MKKENSPLISICIATYNRAPFLNELLSSFQGFNCDLSKFEIVIADGGSNDNTSEIIKNYNNLNIVYLDLKVKGGIDKDFDIAVNNSSGKYVWVFPDDDFISSEAINIVSKSIINDNPDLLIVNSSCWDFNFSKNLNKRNLQIENDIIIHSQNFHNDLFEKTFRYTSYIGCIIIKSELWKKVDSTKYFNSRFIHLGVISEIPLKSKIKIISEPLIKLRIGNAEWSEISILVWAEKWKSIISNFKYLKTSSLQTITFNTFKTFISLLLFQRALGNFNFRTINVILRNYESLFYKFISIVILIIPSKVVRFLYFLRYYLSKDSVGLYNISNGRLTKNKWKSSY